MKIIINTSLNLNGGGLQVGLSFIKECLNIKGHEYHVFLNRNLSQIIEKDVYPLNFHFYDIPKLHFWKYNKYLSELENKIVPDVVFTVFGPTYWRPKAFHIMGFALGHYIYPDSPYWNMVSWKVKLYWYIKKQIHLFYIRRDADEFIVETNDAANRLQSLLKKKTYVVSNTYNCYFDSFLKKNISCYSFLQPKKKDEVRLLSVCTPYEHKNLQIIPAVLDRLSSKSNFNIIFILTISDVDYENLIPLRYRNKVKTVGVVTPEKLPQLYSECDVAFVPSLLECFTANFPEAMVMNKPILASDLEYAHTICKDAALYFDPLSSNDIADKIITLIENPILQEELVSRGKLQLRNFKTAVQRAESYIEIIENKIK